jgi:hypothetical protein
MTDPLATYGRETGTDVEITHSGRKIGIQVTDFSADEGLAPPRRGLRATEARNAAKGQFPAYAIPLQHRLSALRLRVADKVAKASSYDFKEFHEVWLFIAAAVPRSDAVASTFIVPQLISGGDLTREMNEELRQSKYARAYLYIVVGETVYEWHPDSSWRLIHGGSPRPTRSGGELWFKKLFR